MRGFAFWSVALLCMLAAPAVASACELTTSQPDLCGYRVGAGTTPLLPCRDDLAVLLGFSLYFTDDSPCEPNGCLWAPALYEETNGVFGQQRGDEFVDDTCGGTAGEPDTMLF